jgi:hypothetical protein
MDDVVAILILLICLAIGLIIGVYFILRPKPEQTELEDGEILLESPKEKGEGFIGLPFIMIAVFFRALFEIFKFFFISPFINWAENIKEAKDEDKGKVVLRGVLILLAVAALIAIGVYNNSGSSYDYERDHYDEYRNEPGW